MNHRELQNELYQLGYYHGPIDGLFGSGSKKALIDALTAGPDTPMTPQDINRAAMSIGTFDACVYAVYHTEANGDGFDGGRAKILPERHYFSKLTHGCFDASHPQLSNPHWDRAWYPKTQEARYAVLAEWVALDVDAGLQSASYGAFQIMGANYSMCGYSSPWEMVYDLSLTEGDQLDAFVSFVKAKKLDDELRRLDFDAFAEGYNGTAWRQNDYGNKLRANYRKYGGR